MLQNRALSTVPDSMSSGVKAGDYGRRTKTPTPLVSLKRPSIKCMQRLPPQDVEEALSRILLSPLKNPLS